MATAPRDSRASVQFFDVDLFRNKLETYMRKQSHDHFTATNNKKRKLTDRFSTEDTKDELELLEEDSQSYRDDLCFQFGKRQRTGGSWYYALSEEDLAGENDEVSPLALPSPVTVQAKEDPKMAWPFFEMPPHHHHQAHQSNDHTETDPDPMSLAMRRRISGYTEASTTPQPDTSDYYMYDHGHNDNDDNWTSSTASTSASPCPGLDLSGPNLSHISSYTSSQSNSHPQTPSNGEYTDDNNEPLMADLARIRNLPLALDNQLDLDVNAMAPHERQLLAALAPERFEKARLIQRAFRLSEPVLHQLSREADVGVGMQCGRVGDGDGEDGDVVMNDGEYDRVFFALMHV